MRHNSNNHVGMCLLRSSKNVTPVCSQWRGWRNLFTSIRRSTLRERWGLQRWHRIHFLCLNVVQCLIFSNICPVSVDLSSDLSVPLAGETRWAPGSGHSDDEYFWIEAQASHQASVPPPVQWLSPAVQTEGVSDTKTPRTETLHWLMTRDMQRGKFSICV